MSADKYKINCIEKLLAKYREDYEVESYKLIEAIEAVMLDDLSLIDNDSLKEVLK